MQDTHNLPIIPVMHLQVNIITLIVYTDIAMWPMYKHYFRD